MNKFEVGDVVEHNDREGRLVVKMVNGAEVVVQDEQSNLGVYTSDKLFKIPGDDYCYLRRLVIDTIQKVGSSIGTSNLCSARGGLAVTRLLYAADVRCGADMIAHARNKLVTAVTNALATKAFEEVLRKNAEPVVKEADEPVELVHTSLDTPPMPAKVVEEENQTAMLSNFELAKLVLQVANELATFNGFTPAVKLTKDMSKVDVCRNLKSWSNTRNIRVRQSFEMAIKLVDLTRQAESRDAVEEMLEMFEQSEDEDDL